jgi:hypothetical protein
MTSPLDERYRQLRDAFTVVKEEPRRVCRTLFVLAHGTGAALVCEPGAPLEFLSENGHGANEDGFLLEKEGIDFDAGLPDGVYVGTLSLVDDGPGDWPGSREFCARLDDVRLATADEWKAHLAGQWPWEQT